MQYQIAFAILDLNDQQPNWRFHNSLIANFDAMSALIGAPEKSRAV